MQDRVSIGARKDAQVVFFVELARRLAFVMTMPTLDTSVTILTGWVFPPRRRVTDANPAFDDMLAGKRGLMVLGVGIHHDPIVSFRKVAPANRGHRWVVGSVIVRFPLCVDQTFALPIPVRFIGTMTKARRVRKTEFRRKIGRAAQIVHAPCTTGTLNPQLVAPYPFA